MVRGLFPREFDLEQQVDVVARPLAYRGRTEIRALDTRRAREAEACAGPQQARPDAVEGNVEGHRLGDAMEGQVAGDLARAVLAAGDPGGDEEDGRVALGAQEAGHVLAEAGVA